MFHTNNSHLQPGNSYLPLVPPQQFHIQNTEWGRPFYGDTPSIESMNSTLWHGEYAPTISHGPFYLTSGVHAVQSTPPMDTENWLPPSDPHHNLIPIPHPSSFVTDTSSTLQAAVDSRPSMSADLPDYVWLPQRPYALTAHHFTPAHPIEFKVDSGESGIRLSAALNRKFSHLKDRDDLVFELSKSPTITMRLEWPGYASWGRQVRVLDSRSVQQSISREKLAYEVAKTVFKFAQPENGKRPSALEGAPDRERMWSLGEGNIGLDDLVLVSVENVSKGSWQPQLLVRRQR